MLGERHAAQQRQSTAGLRRLARTLLRAPRARCDRPASSASRRRSAPRTPTPAPAPRPAMGRQWPRWPQFGVPSRGALGRGRSPAMGRRGTGPFPCRGCVTGPHTAPTRAPSIVAHKAQEKVEQATHRERPDQGSSCHPWIGEQSLSRRTRPRAHAARITARGPWRRCRSTPIRGACRRRCWPGHGGGSGVRSRDRRRPGPRRR